MNQNLLTIHKAGEETPDRDNNKNAITKREPHNLKRNLDMKTLPSKSERKTQKIMPATTPEMTQKVCIFLTFRIPFHFFFYCNVLCICIYSTYAVIEYRSASKQRLQLHLVRAEYQHSVTSIQCTLTHHNTHGAQQYFTSDALHAAFCIQFNETKPTSTTTLFIYDLSVIHHFTSLFFFLSILIVTNSCVWMTGLYLPGLLLFSANKIKLSSPVAMLLCCSVVSSLGYWDFSDHRWKPN